MYIVYVYYISIGGFKMPNKTIYVSEKDLHLYDRAQELVGGNLSAAISEALRAYVEGESEDQVEFEKEPHEIIVRVGRKGSKWRQKFVGRKLIKWGEGSKAELKHQAFHLYLTQKGQFAIHFELEDYMSPNQSEEQLNVYKDWE